MMFVLSKPIINICTMFGKGISWILFDDFLERRSTISANCWPQILAESALTHSLYPSTILLSMRNPSLCVHCLVSFREMWLNCFCSFVVILFYSLSLPTLLVSLCIMIMNVYVRLTFTYLLTSVTNGRI